MSDASGAFVIRNKLGLHARAAARLVEVASKYPCEVTLVRDGQRANAKSVMGVLLLCGSQGSRIEIEANGDRADEAVRSIGELIDDKFGEDE